MILIDNTVLSNFALIHHPEAIQRAFHQPFGTTEDVLEELNQGMSLQRLPKLSWHWLPIIQMTEIETGRFIQLKQQLGKGEASRLAVASVRGWKIATDDKDARKWAVQIHVPHTGTIGILGLLITQNHITLTEGNSWLHRMIKAGYRSPMKTLDRFMKGH